MRRIWDFSFEFTRLKLELKYVGQELAQFIAKAFGGDIDTWKKKLRSFNDWLTSNIDKFTEKWGKFLIPILKDAKAIFTDIADVAQIFFGDVTNLIYAFLGLKQGGNDWNSILERMAKLMDKVSHVFKWPADQVTIIAEGLHQILVMLGLLPDKPLAMPATPGTPADTKQIAARISADTAFLRPFSTRRCGMRTAQLLPSITSGVFANRAHSNTSTMRRWTKAFDAMKACCVAAIVLH